MPGLPGRPAVNLGIQKQLAADTLRLTRSIEGALTSWAPLPAGNGLATGHFPPKPASSSLDRHTGQGVSMPSVFVAVTLFLLLHLRPTVIALTAIPAVHFHHCAGVPPVWVCRSTP